MNNGIHRTSVAKEIKIYLNILSARAELSAMVFMQVELKKKEICMKSVCTSGTTIFVRECWDNVGVYVISTIMYR